MQPNDRRPFWLMILVIWNWRTFCSTAKATVN